MTSDQANDNWVALLPIVSIQLSEDQWHIIAHHSGLPPEARSYIGRAIAMYRVFEKARHQSGTAAATRAALKDAHMCALDLHRQITKLSNNPRALVALTLALVPKNEFANAMNKRAASLRAQKAIAEIEGSAHWLGAAQKRVAKSKPGAREKALQLQFFVTVLDKILMQFTGQGIDRSSKGTTTKREYVSAACKIADPTIRPSSIEEAMKRQIKSRGKTSR